MSSLRKLLFCIVLYIRDREWYLKDQYAMIYIELMQELLSSLYPTLKKRGWGVLCTRFALPPPFCHSIILWLYYADKAPCKRSVQLNIFLISPWKHTLWVFTRSTSSVKTLLMSTHNLIMYSWTNKKYVSTFCLKKSALSRTMQNWSNVAMVKSDLLHF